MRSVHRQRGFLITDAAFGIMLIAGLVVSMAVAQGHLRRGLRDLNAQRALVRTAEAVLVQMQIPGQTLALPQDVQVRVQRLSSAAAPAAGQTWVQVRVSRDHRTASLIGLVPTDALAPGEVEP